MATRKAISKKTRFDVFKRDLFTCQYCGAHPPGVLLHVDHIVAVASGGTNDKDNLTTACEPCNAGKGARPLTVAPEPLADKARRIAESEEQLIGYQSIMQAKRDRLTRETWGVIRTLNGDECSEVPRTEFQSVKMFIERLGFDDVLAAAEKATMRTAQPFKYFCGICWSIIKEQST